MGSPTFTAAVILFTYFLLLTVYCLIGTKMLSFNFQRKGSETRGRMCLLPYRFLINTIRRFEHQAIGKRQGQAVAAAVAMRRLLILVISTLITPLRSVTIELHGVK